MHIHLEKYIVEVGLTLAVQWFNWIPAFQSFWIFLPNFLVDNGNAILLAFIYTSGFFKMLGNLEKCQPVLVNFAEIKSNFAHAPYVFLCLHT